jgi:hypothetical protein
MKKHYPAWYKMCLNDSVTLDDKTWYNCSGNLGYNVVILWRPESENSIRLKYERGKEVVLTYNVFGNN